MSIQSIPSTLTRCAADASTSSTSKPPAPLRAAALARIGKSTRASRVCTHIHTIRRADVFARVSTSPAVTRETTEEEGEADGYYAPDEGSEESLMAGELLAGDILHSTFKHKAIVGTAAVLAACLFAEGVTETDATSAILAAVVGYYLSDFASGVFHWITDNYGNQKTPLLGGVIAAFQGHHLYPWTITKREFCNNISKVSAPAIPLMAILLTLPLDGSIDVFLSVFTTLVVLSQQFHSWSHSRKSELPDIVVKLQEMGILISRRSHGAHHRKPFESNYCIVSGAWNPILDDTKFFQNLAEQIHSINGVEPRCWGEPDYTWLTGTQSGRPLKK